MTVLGSNFGFAGFCQGNFREEVVRAGNVAGSTVKMSNDRESNLVELHNLEPRNTGLREETRIMESEIEAQKVDRMQKLRTCKC